MSITEEKAKNIASKYVEEPDALVGKPEIKEIHGIRVYVVPVILNKNKIGEIHIDPENGKNIGGAGGAPNG